MYSVMKSMTFDAAHRLVRGYVGKCSNIHGHTWHVEMGVKTELLDVYGMALDFGLFSPLKTWIDDQLDHAMMVASDDSEMIEFLVKNKQKHYIFDGNPTSENTAALIHRIGMELGLPIGSISVWETPTSKATFDSLK